MIKLEPNKVEKLETLKLSGTEKVNNPDEVKINAIEKHLYFLVRVGRRFFMFTKRMVMKYLDDIIENIF